MKKSLIFILCLFAVVSAHAQSVSSCTYSVECNRQGLTHGGSPVDPQRSHPEKALVPEKSDIPAGINFYSLGYGGFITIRSSCPIKNGMGNDVRIWETTYGAQPVNANSDRARIYASQNGVNFQLLGMATYDGSFDLGGLPWASYFRIEDATVHATTNPATADAYDLDGIEALNGYTEAIAPTPITTIMGAKSVCGFAQGKTKDYSNVPSDRSVSSKVLGLPQNTDSYNFYTLGFGGSICLKFEYAVFDGPGNELKLVETTFGSLSCGNNPERVELSVSFDSENWTVIGEYCQDDTNGIDIGPANSGIQYVRLRDVSNRNDFISNSADGYDLDGVMAFGTPCPQNLPNETERDGSPGNLTLKTEADNGFLPLTTTLTFLLDGAQFSTDPKRYNLRNNGKRLVPQSVSLQSNLATFTVALSAGKNDLLFAGTDADGYALVGNYTLWAGNQNMPVSVINADGNPAGVVAIKVALGDDERFFMETNSANGASTFLNLPARTVIVTARTPDNRVATTALVPNGSNVVLKLQAFSPPSSIDNNNFDLGTSGWEIGSSPVMIIPHDEGANPTFAPMTANNDLQLSTSGPGPRSIYRAFFSKPGTRVVKIRFRFVTTEFPTYFGSQFNDYYSIIGRSQNKGTSISEQKSMNGLGFSAFDFSGATAWKELEIAVDPEGDVVQFDVAVANVGDGLVDSRIQIDFIEEAKLTITQAQLFDIDNTALNFISLDNHTYFGGKTRINGTITIKGNEGETVSNVFLEVLKGGAVVANGYLVNEAKPLLLKTFTSTETISITNSRLLFEIPSPAGITGSVSLRIVVLTAEEEAKFDVSGSKLVLNRYAGTNRYGGRDENVGGDDWARPSVVSFLGSLTGYTWGDFSNMNAGSFSPDHATHRVGDCADGHFAGYNSRNTAVATNLINLLNSPTGSRISTIGVTFTPSFSSAIQNVILADGDPATSRIVNWAGHSTHFHLVATDTDPTGAARRAVQNERLPSDIQQARTALAPLVNLQPNPATNSVQVQISKGTGRSTLSLFNSVGQVVLEEEAELGTQAVERTLNLNGLAPGMYIFRLQQGSESTAMKLLVE